MALLVNFTKMFQELLPILRKPPREQKRYEQFPGSLSEASIILILKPDKGFIRKL